MKNKLLCFFRVRYNKVAILSFSLILSLPLSAQNYRHWQNNAFQKGEKIQYRVFYNSMLTGNVKAGDASLSIKKKPEIVRNRKTMHIKAEGNTRGAFSFFFKVMNRYETFIDEQALVPHLFKLKLHEGKYRKKQNIFFNQKENYAIVNDDIVQTNQNIQDIVSSLYFMRTFNYDSAKVGDVYDIQFLLNDSVHVSRILFEGREKIKTQKGTFHTLRFRPEVLIGDVFNQKYPMTLWVSDDENKILIAARTEIIVGSLRMEINDYSGLKNPVSSLTEN
ncbi:MAG: DUF3108 domain-containing protein [Bacteroidota bacterium]